jgi:polysaccharide export outer membrane protein
MRLFLLAVAFAASAQWWTVAHAQTASATPPKAASPTTATPPKAASPSATLPKGTSPAASVAPAGVQTPPDYTIGNDDVLTIVFWRDKDMSTEVQVRPDGKISLPLLNDVQAAGLTPEQLRANINERAGTLIEDPTVSVVVKAINSRRVYITGQVGKPGIYPLSESTTVLQLIAMAGGVDEYADSKKIQIIRTENGKSISHKFNYQDFIKGKNVSQNIELKSGDTVIVP